MKMRSRDFLIPYCGSITLVLAAVLYSGHTFIFCCGSMDTWILGYWDFTFLNHAYDSVSCPSHLTLA
ncbi:hypothetical protein RJT34_19052 [Clitoria ternatea]|uniref:Uncharacterized protein n=1 Tax=Clitoria ternatea TaxID=43366 RepID=A0AAN9IQA6_CLITE